MSHLDKICLALLVTFISTLSFGQRKPSDTAKYLGDHYRQRVKLFNSEPIQKDGIVFLGNSITEFGDWKKLLDNPNTINRGIAGDNTYGVLARLNDVISRKPARVFIEIGVNDIGAGFSTDSSLRNIRSIARQLHRGLPKCRVYVLSLLPINNDVKTDFPQFLNKNPQIVQFNRRLAGQASRCNYTYIDLNPLLKNRYGMLDTRYSQPDGIHLNEKGYGIWIRLLKKMGYI
jgi:lysophospholipase L1-like esterase